MANLSRKGSDALTEVHNQDNLNYDIFNQSEQIMTSSEQSNDVSQTETDITSDSNTIPYSQYLSETQQETVRNIRVNSFTMKMEILLEPTSNKLMVEHAEYDESNTYVLERFNTSAGNPVKKILLKLNLSDHRLCKMVVECQSVKVKEFQERCNIKAFQEWYEHVGPEVASPQDGKVSRWQRDCAWLMISRCSRSQCQIQVQGTSSIQEVNDHYNIFTRESQEYELKTKDKA
ncbi:hypothetical protein Tco_1384216 [Tanacetum coccineum]